MSIGDCSKWVLGSEQFMVTDGMLGFKQKMHINISLHQVEIGPLGLVSRERA